MRRLLARFFLAGRRAALILAAAMMLAPGAHAYIDPGSGSAIITAILGAIGAVGYAARKYYYKVKNLFVKSDKKSDQPPPQ